MDKYEKVLHIQKKGTYYRMCSCGAKLKSTNRASIIHHRQMGHSIPMVKWKKIVEE